MLHSKPLCAGANVQPGNLQMGHNNIFFLQIRANCQLSFINKQIWKSWCIDKKQSFQPHRVLSCGSRSAWNHSHSSSIKLNAFSNNPGGSGKNRTMHFHNHKVILRDLPLPPAFNQRWFSKIECHPGLDLFLLPTLPKARFKKRNGPYNHIVSKAGKGKTLQNTLPTYNQNVHFIKMLFKFKYLHLSSEMSNR